MVAVAKDNSLGFGVRDVMERPRILLSWDDISNDELDYVCE